MFNRCFCVCFVCYRWQPNGLFKKSSPLSHCFPTFQVMAYQKNGVNRMVFEDVHVGLGLKKHKYSYEKNTKYWICVKLSNEIFSGISVRNLSFYSCFLIEMGTWNSSRLFKNNLPRFLIVTTSKNTLCMLGNKKKIVRQLFHNHSKNLITFLLFHWQMPHWNLCSKMNGFRTPTLAYQIFLNNVEAIIFPCIRIAAGWMPLKEHTRGPTIWRQMCSVSYTHSARHLWKSTHTPQPHH